MIALLYENTPNFGGIKRYAIELFNGLSGVTAAHLMAVPKLEVTIRGRKVGGWTSLSLLSRLARQKGSVTHATSHWIINRHTDIATVHDIFPFTMPGVFQISESARRFYLKALERLSHTTTIVVQSRYVRGDVLKFVPDADIRVIPTHVPEYLGETSNPYPEDGRVHLFTMGEILQRNNRKRIAQLYDFVRGTDYDLYHIGRIGNERYRNYAPNIHHVGANIPEEMKQSYLNYADRFVFSTWAEGQGIPAMEAARAGIQPIVSDIPVHHEFLGDKAYYFTDRESFLSAIEKPIKSGLKEQIAQYDNWIEEYISLYREFDPAIQAVQEEKEVVA